MKNHTKLSLVFAGLFLVSLLTLIPATPIVSATPSATNWDIDVLSGAAAEDVDDIAVDGFGTLMGFAYRQTTSNNLGFATGNSTIGFTVKSLDIDPASSSPTNEVVLKVSDSIWLVSANVGTTVNIFRTTDGGVTWTNAHSVSASSSGNSALTNNPNNRNHILFTYYTSAAAVQLKESMDGGVTWGAVKHTFVVSNTGSSDIGCYTEFNCVFFDSGDTDEVTKYYRTEDYGTFWSSFSIGTVGVNTGNKLASISVSSSYFAAIWDGSTNSNYVVSTSGSANAQSTISDGSSWRPPRRNGIDRLNTDTIAITADSATGIPKVFYSNTFTGVASQFATLPDDDQTGVAQIMENRAHFIFSNGTFSGRIEIWSTDLVPPPAEDTDPDDTVTLTGIVGFDISKNGDFVIARTNGGDFIRVYNGEVLTELFNADTNCSQIDGVAAIQDTGIAYFTCSGGSVAGLTISDKLGAAFLQPGDCSALCPSTVFNIDPLAGENNYVDISPFGPLPLVHQSGSKRVFAFNWMVSGSDGKLYNLATSGIETGADDGQLISETSLAYSAATPGGICTATAVSLQGYAVDSVTQTRGYLVSESAGFGGSGITPPTYSSAMSQNYVGISSLNSQSHIDCSNYKFIVSGGAGGTTVRLGNPSSNTVQWTITAPSNVLAVALSGDGNFAAYSVSDKTYLVYANNGTAISNFTNPAGTVFKTKLDYTGQRLYVATGTVIAFFDLSEETGGPLPPVPSGSSSGSGSASSTSTNGGGGFGGAGNECSENIFGIFPVTYFSDAFGISETAMRWLFGLFIVTLIVGAIVLRIGGGVIITSVATLLAIGVAVALCAIPVWFLLVIIFLIVLLVGQLLFGGGQE